MTRMKGKLTDSCPVCIHIHPESYASFLASHGLRAGFWLVSGCNTHTDPETCALFSIKGGLYLILLQSHQYEGYSFYFLIIN